MYVAEYSARYNLKSYSSLIIVTSLRLQELDTMEEEMFLVSGVLGGLLVINVLLVLFMSLKVARYKPLPSVASD